MTRCDYCGRESDNSLVHCRECGTPIFLPDSGPPAPTVTRTWLLSSFFTPSALKIRRVLAVMIAVQAFCALGESRAASNTHGYLVLLTIVFTPVAFIWCNAHPCLIPRLLEGMGWVFLLLFWVIAAGSM